MATRTIEVQDVAELPQAPAVGTVVYVEGKGLRTYVGLPEDERPADGWASAGGLPPE